MSEHKHNQVHAETKLWLESGQTTSEYAVILVVLIPASVLLFSGLAGGPIASAVRAVAGLLP